mgnify:CR=1 FL=1
MKKSIIFILCAFLFMACKDNPAVKKAKEAKDNVVNTKNALQESRNMQDDIKDLSETTPLTNEELKTWLPDNLDGMKRTSYKAGAMGMMNISSLEATYEAEDNSRKFKIEVIDGAGEMGAMATAGMRMALSQDFEEESETKMRRSTTKNGNKAVEEVDKRRSISTVQYMHQKRFYIQATGTNMDLEEVWDLLDEMDVEDLE